MRASSIAVSLGTLTLSSLVRSSYASQNNSGDDSDTGGMSDLLLAIVIVLCAFSLLLVLLTSYFALKLWWILSSTREEKRKSKRIECANNMIGRKFRWVRYGGSPLGRGSFGEVFRAMIVEPLCNCGQSFKHIKHKSGAACFLCLEPQMENESWPGCETCQTRVCNLCFETPCGKQMAVKQVVTERKKLVVEVQKEAIILKRLHHPNIVSVYSTETRRVEASREDNKKYNVFIFMELVLGSSLDHNIQAYGPIPETVMRNFTRQCIRALMYCHDRGIIHRDLKGRNILITSNGLVKITDFGSAKITNDPHKLHPILGEEMNRRLKRRGSSRSVSRGDSNASQLRRRDRAFLCHPDTKEGHCRRHSNASLASKLSAGGEELPFQYTLQWVAPEVVRAAPVCNSKCDIWSLGCVIIEMRGAYPWAERLRGHGANPMALLHDIANTNLIPEIPSDLSAAGTAFITACLFRDPNQRPSARELLEMPWLSAQPGLVEGILGKSPVSLLENSKSFLGSGVSKNDKKEAVECGCSAFFSSLRQPSRLIPRATVDGTTRLSSLTKRRSEESPVVKVKKGRVRRNISIELSPDAIVNIEDKWANEVERRVDEGSQCRQFRQFSGDLLDQPCYKTDDDNTDFKHNLNQEDSVVDYSNSNKKNPINKSKTLSAEVASAGVASDNIEPIDVLDNDEFWRNHPGSPVSRNPVVSQATSPSHAHSAAAIATSPLRSRAPSTTSDADRRCRPGGLNPQITSPKLEAPRVVFNFNGLGLPAQENRLPFKRSGSNKTL